eukprot:Pgem_evm1s935
MKLFSLIIGTLGFWQSSASYHKCHYGNVNTIYCIGEPVGNCLGTFEYFVCTGNNQGELKSIADDQSKVCKSITGKSYGILIDRNIDCYEDEDEEDYWEDDDDMLLSSA